MEMDIHDDMSSLFTFDIDDFNHPPQPSHSSSPDRLPPIEEEFPSNHVANNPHNQQQQLHHQPQQYYQQLKYTLIKHPDGQISLQFLTPPQVQSQLQSNLNPQNQVLTDSGAHSHSQLNLQNN